VSDQLTIDVVGLDLAHPYLYDVTPPVCPYSTVHLVAATARLGCADLSHPRLQLEWKLCLAASAASWWRAAHGHRAQPPSNMRRPHTPRRQAPTHAPSATP
jgi:hypothetical protein